jgi:predicted O-methyltransferase YrrM
LTAIVPATLRKRVALAREEKELRAIPSTRCNTENLRNAGTLAGPETFESVIIESKWNESRARLEALCIPDGTGGVNPGDRRAIYYLISALKPLSVLEIGTHLGASTVHIASALAMNQTSNRRNAALTTVDISDVNSLTTKPWLKYGAKRSPSEMINSLELQSMVEFVTDTSLKYASRCNRKFDFIFLDGDHSAKTVYSEIPLALNLLNPNGVILLHDYFPRLKPLWSSESVIAGPFLATDRLRAEGANICVLPLGALPWPTKLQSNVTSLALLLKSE